MDWWWAETRCPGNNSVFPKGIQMRKGGVSCVRKRLLRSGDLLPTHRCQFQDSSHDLRRETPLVVEWRNAVQEIFAARSSFDEKRPTCSVQAEGTNRRRSLRPRGLEPLACGLEVRRSPVAKDNVRTIWRCPRIVLHSVLLSAAGSRTRSAADK